ncbi:fimbrial protein [Salmonella enterica]|nr:fimbrial protein [Salmonella enterica]
MKLTPLFTALSVSAAFYCAGASAITGTDSVEMTLETEITRGTCTAQVVDAAGTPTDTISYGEVFVSDIAQKSRTVPFAIQFTNCSGIASVGIKAKPGAGGSCSGDDQKGNSYAAGNNAAFELWAGEVDRGTQFTCSAKYAVTDLDINAGEGIYDFTSRIVVASGKTAADVIPGAVSAPITFTLTYH